MLKIPTSNDIYIEFNGKRVGVAQSYRAVKRDKIQYLLTLDRLCVDLENAHGLSRFNVIIEKPDRKIIFAECEWASMSTLNGNVIETIEIVSYRRIEIA